MEPQMILKTLIVSPFATNCYILGCEESRDAAVIDPGDDADSILEQAEADRLKISQIILTHGHTDHVSGAGGVKESTGARILIHRKDDPLLREASRMAMMFGWSVGNPPKADSYLEEGDEVAVGDIRLRVVHTPGHSPGGICLVGDGFVFAGDTLFAGSIGRTDLPGGSHKTLIQMIKDKLMVLPGSTRVLCGHGPSTTVEEEKDSNPFL